MKAKRRHFFMILVITCQFSSFFQVSALKSYDITGLDPLYVGVVSNSGDESLTPGISTSAGDLNGDGYEDIVIGCPFAEENSIPTGLAYVIFGTETGIPNVNFESMTSSQGIKIRGGPEEGYLGMSVDGLGDVNGDGIDDVGIGTQGFNGPHTAYIIFGKRTGLSDFDVSNFGSSQGIKITGSPSSYMGYGIKNVEDVNNDGVNDFMISAPTESQTGVYGEGVVYVIFGQRNGLVDMNSNDLASLSATGRGFRILGTSEITNIGVSLSKAGDVNKDGVADMMIGTIAPRSSSGGLLGTVIVIYGRKSNTIQDVQIDSLTLSQGFKITGASDSLTIGITNMINPAGDVNNDGVDDIVLGAPTSPDSFGNPYSGMIYIIYGKQGGLVDHINLSALSSSQGFTIKGNTKEAYLGYSATSGDIDGDGLNDLVFSSPGATAQSDPQLSPGVGIIYVIFGGQNAISDIDLSDESTLPLKMFAFYGDTSVEQSVLGMVLNIAKDLNGDGVNDIIALGKGKVYALYSTKCQRGVSCSSASPLCYAALGCTCGESDLFFQDEECVSQCSQGYYVNAPICEPCPDTCASCTDSSTCQSCKADFELKEGLCVLPDMQIDIETINSITNITDAFDSATLTAASLIAPQDPGSVSAGMLTKMLQYLRYLDIPYSKRLELTFKPHNSTYGPFGIGPKFPTDTLLRIPMNPIPIRFIKFHVHSSFLVNFWDSLIFIAIILCGFAIFKLIEWIIPRLKKKLIPDTIVRKIRAAVQNMFFMQFYNIFGDVLLFSILELRNLSFDNAETVISFCLAVLFLCLGCFVIAIHISVLLKFHMLRKKVAWISKIEGLYKIYEGSEVFFKHFKNNNLFTQSFLLFFVIRNILFYLTIALLSAHPLVQTMLILTLTLSILAYLIIKRPFNTLVNLFQQIICEVMFLLANTCVFIITQLDFEKENSYKTRDGLCEVIIYTSLVFTFVPQAFLVIKIIIAAVEWYNASRKKPQKASVKQVPKILINGRQQESHALEFQNQSLNDSSATLTVLQNMSSNMQTHDSFSENRIIRDNSYFQTNQARRKLIKRQTTTIQTNLPVISKEQIQGTQIQF